MWPTESLLSASRLEIVSYLKLIYCPWRGVYLYVVVNSLLWLTRWCLGAGARYANLIKWQWSSSPRLAMTSWPAAPPPDLGINWCVTSHHVRACHYYNRSGAIFKTSDYHSCFIVRAQFRSEMSPGDGKWKGWDPHYFLIISVSIIALLSLSGGGYI